MASREAAIKNNLNDRARKVGQFDELTTQDIDALIAFYDYSCLFPGCTVKPATSVDHVKPLSKGGTNTRDNLQLLCTNHNKAKQDEEIDYRKGRICPPDFIAPSAQDVSTNSRDWEPIRLEYVQGQMSLRDLATKLGISYNTIKYHSDKEEWAKERGEFRISVTSELAQKLREQHIDAKTTAARIAYDVISSWLSPFGEPASASDAISAAKLLLLAEGLPTERIDYQTELRKIVGVNDELGETDEVKSPEHEFHAVYAAIRAETGSPSTN